MSVDVQAERLRELADEDYLDWFRHSANPRTVGEANVITDELATRLEAARALLAGQAEQIEALRGQRDNLRDAAEGVLDAINDYISDELQEAMDKLDGALRAAAVGEDERREKSRDEWEREYDDAVQWRDHLTCEQLLVEREGLSWWPVGEDTE